VTRGNGARAGVVGAGRQHGAANEHWRGPGVAPGKKINGGAHPIGGASGGGQWDGATRWRSTVVEWARWSPMTGP
jgi:hypothetical protein